MFTSKNRANFLLLILLSVLLFMIHTSLSFATSSLLVVRQQVSSIVRIPVRRTSVVVFAYQTNRQRQQRQQQRQHRQLFSSTFTSAAPASRTTIPFKFTTNNIHNNNRLSSSLSLSSLQFFNNRKDSSSYCSFGSTSTRSILLQAISESEMTDINSTTETILPVENSETGIGQADIGRQQIIETVQLDDNTNEQEDEIEDSNAIPLQSWRQLLEVSIGKSRKIRGSNYVQIATIDTITNEPRCRTVVFRGFVPVKETLEVFSSESSSPDSSSSSSLYMNNNLSCIMKMITDERSQKVNEVLLSTNTKTKNNMEMVWWFPKTSEQYRIRGTLVFVGDNTKSKYPYDNHPLMIQLRKSTWGNLSDSAREAFYDFKNTPGEPFSASNTQIPTNIPVGGRDENNIVLQPPPSNFLVMLLLPNYCDYLRLTNMYRQIDTIDISSSNDISTWISTRVNP